MAKIRAEQALTPSLLDRLLDDDPGTQREAPRSRTQVLRELKRAVRRDLEDLLNTRRCCLPLPEDLKELERSLVNYGIPDFTGAGMGSSESRDELRRAIEDVIRRHEPRFQTVTVHLLDSGEPL